MTDPEQVARLRDEFMLLHEAARGCEFDLTPADGPIARLTLFVHENGAALAAALTPVSQGGKNAKVS